MQTKNSETAYQKVWNPSLPYYYEKGKVHTGEPLILEGALARAEKRKPTRWQAYRDGNGGLDWTTLTRYYLVMHLEKLIMHGYIITYIMHADKMTHLTGEALRIGFYQRISTLGRRVPTVSSSGRGVPTDSSLPFSRPQHFPIISRPHIPFSHYCIIQLVRFTQIPQYTLPIQFAFTSGRNRQHLPRKVYQH